MDIRIEKVTMSGRISEVGSAQTAEQDLSQLYASVNKGKHKQRKTTAPANEDEEERLYMNVKQVKKVLEYFW